MVHPDSSNLVLTGGEGLSPDYPMVVSYSTDAGGSWTRCLLSDTARGYVYALAIAPSQPRVIYAGGCINTPGAVFVSKDFGRTWNACAGAPTGKVYGLAVHPDDANVVYAAASDSLWKTVNGGTTWTRLGVAYSLKAVCFYPGCPDTVLVGGRYGVALSTDGGGTWERFNAGLACSTVTRLRFGVTDRVRLYAGTGAKGVYGYSFPTGIGEMPNAELRMTNVPTIVRGVLRMPESAICHSTFVLLNAMGREVAELRPGENDIRHLAPGVYFVRGKGSSGRGIKGPSAKVVIQR